MTSKKTVLISLVSGMFAVGLSAAVTTLTGTVQPYVTSTAAFGSGDASAFIAFTEAPGYIFEGPVYNSDGKMIKRGDVLAKIDPTYRELAVKAAEAALQQAKFTMDNDKSVFDRAQQLAGKKIISDEQYVSDKNTYYGAVAAYESAKVALKQAQILLNACYLTAPFDGMIYSVSMSGGWTGGNSDTVFTTYQMDPALVTVKFDHSMFDSIDQSTPVTIYPLRGDGKPLGVMHGKTIFNSDNSVSFSVDNILLPPANIDKGKAHVIQEWSSVLRTRNSARLKVAMSSLFKDGDKFFVWKVAGLKNMVPGKGMGYLGKLEKVDVTNIDHARTSIPFEGPMVKIPNNNPSLAYGDVLLDVNHMPKNPVNGMDVCLYHGMFQLMPGDKVKVELDLPAADQAKQ